MKSTIRLFKALPVKKQEVEKNLKISPELLKEIIPYGFLISPEILSNYSKEELITFIEMIKEEIGIHGAQMNQSFHKSWKKIEDASCVQLVLEQLFHYITTYGYEFLGIYSEDSVYIPVEKLEIPEIDVDTFHFVVIRGITNEELKKKTLNLLVSGVALKKETIEDVVEIATYLELNENEIEMVKNKEIKIILYEGLDKIPKNPIEFLRYCIYKSTNQTLLIKNDQIIEQIKNSDSEKILPLFLKYKQEYGFKILAQIFFRFKPLFLAFRTNPQMKPITNKLRKLATFYHKPLERDYLNEVTSLIERNEINETILNQELLKVNIFRKIRLAYALNYRLNSTTSIVYNIRNGKGFATEFKFTRKEKLEKILSIVLDSIVSDIKPNVVNKRIYIPQNITYALPKTEKQFIGNFPSGSSISLSEDMIVGIQWDNVDQCRVDLDLSLIDKDSGKFGWDGSYRSHKKNVLFSGDLTDAPSPNGASELFYIKKQTRTTSIVLVNFYNYSSSLKVPFKIIVAKGEDPSKNFVIDPNNVITTIKSNIINKQKIIGLIKNISNTNHFYFTGVSLGCNITSSETEYIKHARNYLENININSINLQDILQKAGSIITTEKEGCDIDLSPEALEKDTILDMFN